MENTTPLTSMQTPEAVALAATIQLHGEMLNDECFAGYDGDKDAFDVLYQEVFVIARDDVTLEVDPVNQVVDMFYEYHSEICNGTRDIDWYLYR